MRFKAHRAYQTQDGLTHHLREPLSGDFVSIEVARAAILQTCGAQLGPKVIAVRIEFEDGTSEGWERDGDDWQLIHA